MVSFYPMRVLDRYIIKEQLKIFFLSGFILFSVLMLEKVNFLSTLLLTQNAPAGMVGELLIYISPVFLTLAMPLAVLMSTLMSFSRLSAENEVTAMRASGISLYRLLAPVFFLSVAAGAITLYLTTNLTHKGNLAFRQTVISILHTNFNLDIKERKFYSDFPGMVIHVNENNDGQLKGVFISDQRIPGKAKVIESTKGVLIPNPDSEFVTMRLENGVIHTTMKSKAYRTIAFDQYALSFDLSKRLNEPLEKEIPHLSVPELKARIESLKAEGKPANAEIVALHKKYSIPVGCIVLGLLGAPVGIMTHRRGSAGGFGIGVLLIVSNYFLLMMGQGLGAGGKIPPALAMWAPNVIMGLIGVYFTIRVSKDTMPTRAGIWLEEAWNRLWRFVAGRRGG